MNVEPAHINQIRKARDGRWLEVDADVGNVAADLKRIDAGFKVRFAEAGGCWVVYHEHHDGCPHNGTGGAGSTYLVLTAQAHQTNSGSWAGLDQRVVREVERMGHASYDYAREVEVQNRRAEKARDDKAREKIREDGEHLAHALRKDMGWRYKGRAFTPTS